MLQVAFAKVWTWTDARNLHLSHATLHMLSVDIPALKTQLMCNPATSVHRMIRVYFVYTMLEFHLHVRRFCGLVVQARATYAQGTCRVRKFSRSTIARRSFILRVKVRFFLIHSS